MKKSSKNRKMKSFGLALGLLTSATIAGFAWTKGSTPASVLSALAESRIFAPKDLTLTIENRRHVGESVNSRLRLQNSGSFRFGAADEKGKALIDQKVSTLFDADITEIILSDDGRFTRSYLVLSETQLSLDLNGQQQHEFAQMILSDFSAGLLLVRDRQGLVVDVITRPDAQDFSRDMAYTLAKSLQYAFPEGQVKGSWSTSESDPSGNYQARYTLLDKEGERAKLRRERLHYTKLSARLEGELAPELEGRTSGELILSYDAADQQLLEVSGTEGMQLFDETQRQIGSSEHTIDWTFLNKATLTPENLATYQKITEDRFAASRGYEDLKAEADERQERGLYEKSLGNANLDSLNQSFAEIDSMSDRDKAEKAMTDLFLKARALVYLHPEKMDEIRSLLQNSPVESAFFQTMTSALVNISSPEAQRALVDLTMSSRENRDAIRSLIPDLGFVKNPEPIVEEALRSLMQDEETKGMADLALAAMGSQLGKSEQSEAKQRRERITDEVVSAARSASDSESLQHQLDMLGNLAAQEALPALEEALEHSEVAIRSTAAYALRDVGTLEAQNRLLSVLREDKAGEVRLNAASALQSYRVSPDLFEAQVGLLEKEGDEKVRIQLLLNIVRAKYMDSPRVQGILEARSQKDPSEQARNYAATLLTEFSAR